ncbi:MAG: polysaccharide biosynthesis protein [Opitutae bacterium]|nr:polysaccharide biosynthesis protein [Opitutae bacterium]
MTEDGKQNLKHKKPAALTNPVNQPTSTPRSFSASTFGERISRALALIALYTAVLTACRYFAYEVRFDFLVPHEFQEERLYSLAVNLPIKLGFLLLFRQFGSLLTYFSVPDLMRIAAAMASANLVSYLLRYGFNPGLMSPRGVVLIDFVLGVGALSAMRLGFRIYRERYLTGHSPNGKAARRIAVLGAGDAGAEFVRETQAKPSLGLRPVFFLDDDWKKHGHSIHGISVLGAPEEIARLRKDYPIDACVLAMPSAPAKRLQEIYKVLTAEGLKVEIVPSMAELASGRVQVTKIRPVQVEDLLGRDTVDLRSDDVAALVRDKVILVTGAGGSIGAELCRQIAGYHPQRLLLVEQAEGSLFNIEAELNERGQQHLIVPLVADIMDADRMRFIFERYTPQVVFHAAAHKHVFMMERQPGEAVKNNTTGTRRLAELAVAKGVGVFVLISTDKAINPTSAMGASKRLAELHLLALQDKPGNRTRFMAVRFGNVLGSSGSVIPIFKQQIATGGPVTVTHPDVTRYFMTIPEAVGLVLRTTTLGQGGEIFVLDMGKPVKIVDLARQLIELSGLRPGEDIEIKFIGLRAGEKLFEELQHHSEQLKPTAHERIHLLAASAPHGEKWVADCRAELEEQAGQLDPNQLRQRIRKFVPEYSPHLD